MIISVLNQKGGSGKTTIATNLARAYQLSGKKTLLVDSDPQGSARDWNDANEGALLPVVGLDRPTLPKDLENVKADYEVIVVDGAPQLLKQVTAALLVSEFVLIPVQPSPYDIWACSDLVELVQQRQEITGDLKAAFVVSRVIKNTKLSKDASSAISEYPFPVLTNFTSQRVVYASSASTGSTVLDDKNGVPAKNEILGIKAEIDAFGVRTRLLGNFAA